MRAVTHRTAVGRVLMGALPVAALVAVAALATVLPRLGGDPERAAAQEDTSIVVSLDMDTTDGGPCAHIDSSASHDTGDSYDVAICVEGLYEGFPIGLFALDVLYDDTLNRAPEVADVGKGFDDNPDANLGTTRWPTNTSEGLGTDVGWDCSATGLAYPRGDWNAATGPGNGAAFITCDSLNGPYTMGDDETSGVIAVISFIANYGGTDTLTIASGLMGYTNASEMGSCNPSLSFEMACNGGTDNKSVGGVGGSVKLPPAAIAAEASAAADGPGSSTPNGIVWAGAMAGGILLLAAGGWYARRRYER